MNDDQPIPTEVESLRTEHRLLDEQIGALALAGAVDQLEIARLKKQKLALKDRIERLIDLSTPDIIA